MVAGNRGEVPADPGRPVRAARQDRPGRRRGRRRARHPARAGALEDAFTAAFGRPRAGDRARHLSALRSALAWWAQAGWLTADPTAGWARPKVPVDATRALTRAQVAAIWRLDVPLRDKTLWRMLYETAARAEEILGLDVPDLDLPSKRGRVISKGSTTDWVHWQTGAAMLLPRLLAGRREGPVFLAARKPGRAVASADLCPVTGRAWLSYRRAAESFELTTRPLASPGASPADPGEAHGWTLHQLRHSLLTHEAEDGTSPPCCSPGPVMPPSGHSSATAAPAPRPSPATSPPPTPPPGATDHDRPAGRALVLRDQGPGQSPRGPSPSSCPRHHLDPHRRHALAPQARQRGRAPLPNDRLCKTRQAAVGGRACPGRLSRNSEVLLHGSHGP